MWYKVWPVYDHMALSVTQIAIPTSTYLHCVVQSLVKHSTVRCSEKLYEGRRKFAQISNTCRFSPREKSISQVSVEVKYFCQS